MNKIALVGAAAQVLMNKRVRIYLNGYIGVWAIATVSGWAGSYLVLQQVYRWNGNLEEETRVHAKWIDKIEIQPEPLN